MAFERARIHINAASVGTGFKVRVTKRKGPACISFTLTKALAAQFGWSDGDKLELFVGTDSDHGLLRFRKNNSVGDAPVSFKKSAKGDWVSIPIGHQARFVDEAQLAAWVKFEQIEGGFVEVVLPRWADKTRPAKVAASVPSSKPAAPPAHALRKNVTSDIMGDPPAGRREMLERLGSVKA
ncbi:hypothetical protein [Rhizobium sp. MHM7A]|uniref:hypothetical protein n=1 Tax=Rhizobium sp. MHM7A TaxID=2583233 RepID=UPI0011064F41|nr:hypothetical protein [Rhizobium sp. MHM7A]TLX12117.1 hypothetical protein FFR93_16240 [Rhizobium sp. MHM7A]